jgi:hypothetical protein
MDSKGFFLGLIAAVVLFLLWKKEQVPGSSFLQNLLPQATPSSNGGCAGCGGGPNPSPSMGAAPVSQSAMAMVGMEGQISPGTPPLQTVSGSGSFYNSNGPTPDTTFISHPSPLPAQQSNTSQMVVAGTYTNVPGSPTTPANQVPVRATQPVAPTSQLGFHQRYGVSGVSRSAGARFYIQ